MGGGVTEQMGGGGIQKMDYLTLVFCRLWPWSSVSVGNYTRVNISQGRSGATKNSKSHEKFSILRCKMNLLLKLSGWLLTVIADIVMGNIFLISLGKC